MFSRRQALLSLAACCRTYREGVSLGDCRNLRLFANAERAGLAVDLPDDSVLIAFRGTASLDDWSRNLQATLVEVPGFAGRVHTGFACSWAHFMPWLTEQLRPGCRVHLTGHSAGGAVATLASVVLQATGYDVQPVYTFGSPRTGDAAFAAAYQPVQYRVMNGGDPVPDLPPEAAGYYHVGMGWTVAEDAEVRPWWSRLLSLFTQAASPAQTLVDAVQRHTTYAYFRALASLKE